MRRLKDSSFILSTVQGSRSRSQKLSRQTRCPSRSANVLSFPGSCRRTARGKLVTGWRSNFLNSASRFSETTGISWRPKVCRQERENAWLLTRTTPGLLRRRARNAAFLLRPDVIPGGQPISRFIWRTTDDRERASRSRRHEVSGQLDLRCVRTQAF